MKNRSRVSRRIDRKIFTRTARKMNKLNVPGQVMQRGGTRL